MIIGAEIAMLVMGLYALIAGKLPTNKKAKHIVQGWPARVIGIICLLPLPLALVVSTSVAVLFAALGRQVTQGSFFWVGTAIEGSIVVACVVAVAVLSRIYRIPVVQPLTLPAPSRLAEKKRQKTSSLTIVLMLVGLGLGLVVLLILSGVAAFLYFNPRTSRSTVASAPLTTPKNAAPVVALNPKPAKEMTPSVPKQQPAQPAPAPAPKPQPAQPAPAPAPEPRPAQTPKGEERTNLLADLKSSDETALERASRILQQTRALQTLDAKVAEKAVLPLLTDSNVFVRCAAVKMLADVGGRDSIAPLEKLAKENNVFHSGLARQALVSIRDRARIDRTTPPPTSHELVKSLGLLAYWSFDEGEGERAADASGNDLHAKLVKAGWTDGTRGKALRLSGPGSYLDYGDSPRLSFAAQTPFTIAFWTRTTRSKGTLLSQRNNRDGGAVIDISIADGKAKVQVRQDGNAIFGPTEVVSGTINDGGWHHLALTREGDHIELFLDGVSQGRKSGKLSGGAITTDLRALGAERYWITHNTFAFGDPHFEGDMDEFCIFDRVLKANEIAALALR